MNASFYEGARKALPPCLGLVPVGISVGMLGVQAGFTPLEIILMSAMCHAASSQLLVISMMTGGASLGTMILGTFFLNLRHIVMSSYVGRVMEPVNLPRRLLSSFALCDETFAVFSLSRNHTYPFLLGANTLIYIVFSTSTAIGTILTDFLPPLVEKSLGIACFAAFLGMLLPSVRNNARLIALVALTAALNSALQFFLPVSWSIILSMLLGAAIGTCFVKEPVADTTGTDHAPEQAGEPA